MHTNKQNNLSSFIFFSVLSILIVTFSFYLLSSVFSSTINYSICLEFLILLVRRENCNLPEIRICSDAKSDLDSKLHLSNLSYHRHDFF